MKREDVASDDFCKVGIERLIGVSSRFCEKPLPQLTQHDFQTIWDKTHEIKKSWLEAGGTVDCINDHLTDDAVSLLASVVALRDEKFGGVYRLNIRLDDFCTVIRHLIAAFSNFSPPKVSL